MSCEAVLIDLPLGDKTQTLEKNQKSVNATELETSISHANRRIWKTCQNLTTSTFALASNTV